MPSVPARLSQISQFQTGDRCQHHYEKNILLNSNWHHLFRSPTPLLLSRGLFAVASPAVQAQPLFRISMDLRLLQVIGLIHLMQKIRPDSFQVYLSLLSVIDNDLFPYQLAPPHSRLSYQYKNHAAQMPAYPLLFGVW